MLRGNVLRGQERKDQGGETHVGEGEHAQMVKWHSRADKFARALLLQQGASLPVIRTAHTFSLIRVVVKWNCEGWNLSNTKEKGQYLLVQLNFLEGENSFYFLFFII